MKDQTKLQLLLSALPLFCLSVGLVQDLQKQERNKKPTRKAVERALSERLRHISHLAAQAAHASDINAIERKLRRIEKELMDARTKLWEARNVEAGKGKKKAQLPVVSPLLMGSLVVRTNEPKLWAYWRNGAEGAFDAEFITWAEARDGVCRFQMVPVGKVTIMRHGHSGYPRGWPKVGSAEVRGKKPKTLDLTHVPRGGR